MKADNATTRPWKYSRVGNTLAYRITDLSDNSPAPARAIGEANARFIVKAVNNFDDMLEALKQATKSLSEVDHRDRFPTYVQITKLIAKIQAITNEEKDS